MARKPALTPEERENQLVALAYDVAEQKLRDGTASSQLVVQLLRAGSSKDALEKQRIEQQNALDAAKIANMESHAKLESLFKDAMEAIASYRMPTYDD